MLIRKRVIVNIRYIMSLIAIVTSGFASHAQDGQIPFNQWLDALKLEAIEKGYSKELVNTAFSNITPQRLKLSNKIIINLNSSKHIHDTYAHDLAIGAKRKAGVSYTMKPILLMLLRKLMRFRNVSLPPFGE